VEIPDIVYKIMQKSYHLVKLPEEIQKAIHYVCLEERMNMLSPNLVRIYLKSNPGSYCNLEDTEKLDLLMYCLGDNNYPELIDLQLVPMANGSFESFEHYYCENLYVCTEECFIDLFPVGRESVISCDNENLQYQLQDVAKSEATQLRLLECENVARILKKSYPARLFEQNDEVSVDELKCSEEWFETFWKWVKNKNLNLFSFRMNHLYLKIALVNGLAFVGVFLPVAASKYKSRAVVLS